MAQSPLTVILKEVICGLISVILIVLNTVNLQFQGAGHSRLLEAAYVQLQSGHDAVSFFHMAEVSLSMSRISSWASTYCSFISALKVVSRRLTRLQTWGPR